MGGAECGDVGNCDRPTGLACVGERWSADECGSGIHVVQGSFWRGCLGRSIACSKNVVGVRGRPPPVGALCVSTCVSNMLLAAALRWVLFIEREIAASVIRVGVFCITMTRYVLVQMVVSLSFGSTSSVSTKLGAVTSRFTHGVAVFVSCVW